MCTHEQFINAVKEIAIARLPAAEREPFDGIKMVYGAGQRGLRGVTYYNVWQNGHDDARPFVEVCAFGEHDWVQVAGTAIHELAHVLAGFEAGHRKGWKEACAKLGLRHCRAAGTKYSLGLFTPDVRMAIAALPKPSDGEPKSFASQGITVRPKPCTAGRGSCGGRIVQSTRLHKCECGDCGYTVRVSRKWLEKGAPHCPEHGAMDVV